MATVSSEVSQVVQPHPNLPKTQPKCSLKRVALKGPKNSPPFHSVFISIFKWLKYVFSPCLIKLPIFPIIPFCFEKTNDGPRKHLGVNEYISSLHTTTNIKMGLLLKFFLSLLKNNVMSNLSYDVFQFVPRMSWPGFCSGHLLQLQSVLVMIHASVTYVPLAVFSTRQGWSWLCIN